MLLPALLALQLASTGAPAPADTLRPARVAALVARARDARYQQDSALASYETTVRQRISGSIGVSRGLVGQIGRPRLAARIESVARVGWDHALGAWGEVIAARSVVPIVGETEPSAEDEDVALVLPYYPGRDRLWPVTEMRDALPEIGTWIRHPLEAGADTVYAFALGDSLLFRLPDASRITLREIRVRPRRPDSHLVVGSLWVDAATGALVRAAYRPSMPMDLWPFFGEELDREDQDKVRRFGPFLGTVREVLVEHGLYEGRFWLPRTRIASAEGTARIGRVTASIEQTFTYQRVTAVPAGRAWAYRAPEPERDPRDGRIRRGKWRGVEDRSRRCRERGDTSARWSPDSLLRDDDLSIMYSEGVRMHVLLPCSRRDLVESPELPPSIYDASDALFTGTDFDALRRDVEGALAMGSQAEWQPLPPTLHYGLAPGLLRYNRVEGLSAGARIERVLGSGYSLAAEARIATAQPVPKAEVALTRTGAKRVVRLAAYHRLVAANDWGDPLSLGASINAALFARDDGFWFDATGLDVRGTRQEAVDGPSLTWRLFAERHHALEVETQESVSGWISGTRFLPNVQARAGNFAGGAGALGFAWGLDPRGTRLSGAVRVEAAAVQGGERTGQAGDGYGRAMLDATLLRGLGGSYQLSITGAAGSSAGGLPSQRYWFLGGPHTVRGHRAGAMAGDAFWLGRLEMSRGHPLVRPTFFGDIGWAGSRERWSEPGRPLSGAGVGAAMLDGMVRLDVARALGSGGRWRAEFYFEVR